MSCAGVRDTAFKSHCSDATSYSCDLEQIISPLGASGAIEQSSISVTGKEKEDGRQGAPLSNLLHGYEDQALNKPQACGEQTERPSGFQPRACNGGLGDHR